MTDTEILDWIENHLLNLCQYSERYYKVEYLTEERKVTHVYEESLRKCVEKAISKKQLIL